VAVWAHPCIPCRDPEHPRYVACDAVADLDPQVRIVHIRVGRRWICARLDRARRESVEGLLVRELAASDAGDCEGCRDDD
jgi:hypothetical protein